MHFTARLRNLALVLLLGLGAAGVAHATPNTVQEAFTELNVILSSEERAAFAGKPEDVATTDAHFGIALRIRNEWLLPKKSKLAAELRGYGAQSFDEMSSLLLAAFWRHLNGKPFNLKSQAECYRRWYSESRRRLGLADQGVTPYKDPEFSCSGA